MGMLDRYRKPGGFLQLVMLLETCGVAKQEKFLKIVRYEAPLWHVEMKTKIVDLQRIYSWQDSVVQEVVGQLSDLCLAVIIHSSDEALKARLIGMVSHGRKRNIDDLLSRNPPSPGEVTTMQVKVIETTRKLINDGFLRVEQFDPTLAIENGIEDRLNRSVGSAFAAPPSANTQTKPVEFETDPAVVASVLGETGVVGETLAESSVETDHANTAAEPAAVDPGSDVQFLRKKVAELAREVMALRQELGVANSKLEQIKKIA